jgi:hypothetical protein
MTEEFDRWVTERAASQSAYKHPPAASTVSVSATGPEALDNLLLAGLRNGSWLDQQTFAPVDWVVPGIVPEGASMLAGGPKVGKSWMILNIALAKARGGTALGCIEVGQPAPVLYLALEDSDRRLQDRIRTLDPYADTPRLFEYLTRVEPGMVVPTIRAWVRRQKRVSYVILDTYGKTHPRSLPGESEYQRDYRVTGALKEICDDHPGMALQVLHHDRKASSDDFVETVSGTNGVAGCLDTICVLQRRRNETDGFLKVTGRDVEENEYAVEFRGGLWSLKGDSAAEAVTAAETIHETRNLGDRSAEILQFVKGNPAGVRGGQVAKKFDMEPKHAGTYLLRLEKAGKVRKADRGLYTSVESVESVESTPETPLNSTHSTHSTAVSGGANHNSRCDACGKELYGSALNPCWNCRKVAS